MRKLWNWHNSTQCQHNARHGSLRPHVASIKTWIASSTRRQHQDMDRIVHTSSASRHGSHCSHVAASTNRRCILVARRHSGGYWSPSWRIHNRQQGFVIVTYYYLADHLSLYRTANWQRLNQNKQTIWRNNQFPLGLIKKLRTILKASLWY